GVAGIDERADFARLSKLRDEGDQQAAASGRCWPADLRQATARKAANERVNCGNSCVQSRRRKYRAKSERRGHTMGKGGCNLTTDECGIHGKGRIYAAEKLFRFLFA